jgi:hypothetical protein
VLTQEARYPFAAPGKPVQNDLIAVHNRRPRDQLLNETQLSKLALSLSLYGRITTIRAHSPNEDGRLDPGPAFHPRLRVPL